MNVDELLDLTVDEQEEELENLSVDQLQELEVDETRQTALDNIKSELFSRREDEEETEKGSGSVEVSYESKDDRVEELERKVSYLIDRCKTTSEEGFENYED